MRHEFSRACSHEINRNKGKGDWYSWTPGTKELTNELSWHVAKLMQALLNGDEERTKEYSCDVAMYCDKAHMLSYKLKGYNDGGRNDLTAEDEFDNYMGY